MNIDVIASDDITIVKPDGDIRARTILSLRSAFEKLEKENILKIAIDLSGVKFIDSSGIGILLNFAKRREKCNGCLCFYNYSDDVKELLDLIGIEDIIPVYSDFDKMKHALSDLNE